MQQMTLVEEAIFSLQGIFHDQYRATSQEQHLKLKVSGTVFHGKSQNSLSGLHMHATS